MPLKSYKTGSLLQMRQEYKSHWTFDDTFFLCLPPDAESDPCTVTKLLTFDGCVHYVATYALENVNEAR